MKNKTVFLYDPNEINSIFLLSVIKKLGFQIWPIEKLWQIIISDYSPIFVILGPHHQNLPDIKMYLWILGNKVRGFINPFNIQKDDANPDIQLVLAELANKSMLKNTEDMSHSENWGKNLMAARYGMALSAAKISLKNNDKLSRLELLIERAIVEINSGKQDYEISNYEKNYENCVLALIEAKSKIKTDNSPVKLGREEIAYGYIDNISQWLDITKLQQDIITLHPFLSIIQYRNNNKEYTFVGSGTINVNLIFDIKNNDKSPYSAILQGSHAKIMRMLTMEAKSLST